MAACPVSTTLACVACKHKITLEESVDPAWTYCACLPQVTRWFVGGAITLYALYAAWVFLGDEWHARGRPRLQPDLSWQDVLSLLSRWAGLGADEARCGSMDCY